MTVAFHNSYLRVPNLMIIFLKKTQRLVEMQM